MSKRAEQAANMLYPIGSKIYKAREQQEALQGACINGYELAEKDLALTWEDIRAIDELLTLVYEPDNEKDYYQRVLEEFNKKRE